MADHNKILHLVSPDGDWEPFARITSLAAALREYGFSSVVAAPDHSSLWEFAEGAGVEVVEYALERSINPLRWKDLASMVTGTGAGIVHVHDNEAATQISRAGMFMGPVDVVSTRYELDTPLSGAEYGGKVKAVACPSQAMADAFVKAGVNADRLHVVADGVNLAVADRSEEERAGIRGYFRDAYCPDKEKPLFLVNIAPLNEAGGQRALIEAMPDILAVLPQTHLFIMGEGPLLDDLKRQRKIMALKNDVTLLEPDKTYHRLLAATDLYVSWSREDPSGMMVQAAMAAGRCVVLRDSGCYRELAESGKTGIFAQGEDVENLREAVLEPLENRTRREKMGRLAKTQAAARFGMKQVAEQMAGIYRGLPGSAETGESASS